MKHSISGPVALLGLVGLVLVGLVVSRIALPSELRDLVKVSSGIGGTGGTA